MEKIAGSGYPLKVWIFTLISAPILLMVFGAIYKQADLEMFVEAIPAIIGLISFGFFFSLPAFAVYGLVYLLLRRIITNVSLFKVCMATTGVLVTFGTFYLLKFPEDENAFLSMPNFYSMVLGIASFWVPLNTVFGKR